MLELQKEQIVQTVQLEDILLLYHFRKYQVEALMTFFTCFHYLLFNYSSCFLRGGRKKTDTGASPNFEKRVLARISQQPSCLHSVYMMQNL